MPAENAGAGAGGRGSVLSMSNTDKKMVDLAIKAIGLEDEICSSIIIVIREDRSVELKSSVKGEPPPFVVYFLKEVAKIINMSFGNDSHPVANRLPI